MTAAGHSLGFPLPLLRATVWSPCGDVVVCLVLASNQEAVTPSPAHPRARRRRQLPGAGSWRAVWEEGKSGRAGCQPPPPEECGQSDVGSAQSGATLHGKTRRTQHARPPGASAHLLCWPQTPPLVLRADQARLCPGAAATTTTPQCGRRTHRARHPQVPAAEPGPERAAPAKVTQQPGQGVLGSYRGVGGAGGARAQVAVELVLLGARLHGAAAGAA